MSQGILLFVDELQPVIELLFADAKVIDAGADRMTLVDAYQAILHNLESPIGTAVAAAEEFDKRLDRRRVANAHPPVQGDQPFAALGMPGEGLESPAIGRYPACPFG